MYSIGALTRLSGQFAYLIVNRYRTILHRPVLYTTLSALLSEIRRTMDSKNHLLPSCCSHCWQCWSLSPPMFPKATFLQHVHAFHIPSIRYSFHYLNYWPESPKCLGKGQ